MYSFLFNHWFVLWMVLRVHFGNNFINDFILSLLDLVEFQSDHHFQVLHRLSHHMLRRCDATMELISKQLVSSVIIPSLLIELVLDISIKHTLLFLVQHDFHLKLPNLFHYIINWRSDRWFNMVNLTDPLVSISLLNFLEPEEVLWQIIIVMTISSPSEQVLILQNHWVKLLVVWVMDIRHHFLVGVRHNSNNQVQECKGQHGSRCEKQKLPNLTLFPYRLLSL